LYIVILGAPGAGKGTQAQNIAAEMKLEHIASGDLFRQAIEKGNELGVMVKEYMKKGTLVPDKLTIQMILRRLGVEESENGVVLDGFPRNIKQAVALDAALKEQGKGIDKAVYIEVSEKELAGRLVNRWVCRKCQTPRQIGSKPPGVGERCRICGGELYQRADDNEETIKKRLGVYFKETMPVVEYYRKQDKLLEVDGEGSVEAVTARILGVLSRSESGRPNCGSGA
jgi:adenylate kinase